MQKTIDYYLSTFSPWSYLGGDRLTRIAAAANATVTVLPIRLGEVFARTGGVPLPKRSVERQAYRLVELRRWRDFLGVPLILEPRHFPPSDESTAAFATITARARGDDALALATAIGRALWEEDRDIADRAVIADAARSVGLDLAALEADPAWLAAAATWNADTEAAIVRGVFAVPTYVYRDELFWGQDRLDFLERALAG